MNPQSILLLALVLALAVVALRVYRRSGGSCRCGGSCAGDCARCGGSCPHCPPAREQPPSGHGTEQSPHKHE